MRKNFVSITGMGIISSIGNNLEENFSALINKKTGLSQISHINTIHKNKIKVGEIKYTNNELIDHFKENASSVYHPCGTCRMSKEVNTGVVSEKLKVHGLDNLWVVDASIMPNITSGNINAPVMMLSHLSSKIIIEDLKQQYQ